MLKGKKLGDAIRQAVDLKIASGKAQSQTEIAKHFGIKPPSIHDWFKKGSISKDKLPELWRYFSDVVGMDHWGLSGTAAKMASELGVLIDAERPEGGSSFPELTGSPILEWEKPEDLPEGRYVIVRRYDLHVAAGNGHVVYDEQELDQGKAYRTDYIRSEGFYAKDLLCVRARGDSMEPVIASGDTLLIDRSQCQIQDRGVYVLRYGNEIRVKRLYLRPDGGLRIVSDNPQFPEEIVTGADMRHIEILGRVVERSGRV